MLETGKIQAIEPDHGARSVFAVVVVMPGWGKDDVALFHVDPLTVHGGKAAAAFDNEAHGECGVSVGWGDLVGHDELEPGVESVCCVGCI